MNLSFKVKKSSGHIFRFLSDPKLFVAVHPVITRMQPNADGSYKVYETLRFGPIQHSFTYQATIRAMQAENTVIIQATVIKLIRVKIIMRLKKMQVGTLVEEEMEFKNAFLFRPVLQRIFREQHSLLFKNIEAVE